MFIKYNPRFEDFASSSFFNLQAINRLTLGNSEEFYSYLGGENG